MAMINLRGSVAVLLASVAIITTAQAAKDQRQQIPERSYCDIARAILKEANGDERRAEMIARKRGYGEYAIAAARKLCSRD